MGSNIDIGPISLRGDLLFVFVLGCTAMIGLTLLLKRTRLGLATRAVSQQGTAARLCGMNITTTNLGTFVIAGLLGGTAGAMAGAAIGVLSPLLTLPLTVKGLVVTVIGGLGSIPGAIVAGLLVGGFENLFQYWRGVSERDIYVMLLLFAFLLVRERVSFMPADLVSGKLDQTCETLLQHMALMFVPAGVGVVQRLDVLARYGLGITVIIVFTTAFAIAVTALTFNLVDRLMPNAEGER